MVRIDALYVIPAPREAVEVRGSMRPSKAAPRAAPRTRFLSRPQGVPA